MELELLLAIWLVLVCAHFVRLRHLGVGTQRANLSIRVRTTVKDENLLRVYIRGCVVFVRA